MKTILLVMLLNIMLNAQNGFLSISTVPTDAYIYINGNYKGKAPIELITLPTGKHTISITFENYETESYEVLIKNNEIEKREIRLKKKEGFIVKPLESKQIEQGKGKLTIITEPSGATISIDGQIIRERTPLTIEELGTGNHRIEIRKYLKGKLNDELVLINEVEIKKNKTELLKVNLNDFIIEGIVEFQTNISDAKSNQIEISQIHPFNKTMTKRIPSTDKLLVGSYIVKTKHPVLKGQFEKRLEFEVIAEKKTIIYLPLYEEVLQLRVVKDHNDYITLEDYYNSMGDKFLPETKRVESTRIKYNGWFTLALVTAGIIGISPLVYNDIESEVIFLGLGIAAVEALIGLIVGIDSYSYRESVSENKIKNNITRDELKITYELLYKKWQKDIEEENRKIKLINEEIEQRNRLIPEASVRYE